MTGAPITADHIGVHAAVTITGHITKVVAGRILYLQTADGHEFCLPTPDAAPQGVTWQLTPPAPTATVLHHAHGWTWACRHGHRGTEHTETAAWQAAATHTCERSPR